MSWIRVHMEKSLLKRNKNPIALDRKKHNLLQLLGLLVVLGYLSLMFNPISPKYLKDY